jgi:glycosyltransferase involved in cell wall biosynthesis
MTMRILFVGMAHSIHVVRWIAQLRGLGWDVHLFPSQDVVVNPEFQDITIHDAASQEKPEELGSNMRLVDDCWQRLYRWPLPFGGYRTQRFLERHWPLVKDRAWRLAQTIRNIQPDIVHSLEIQHAGYLTLDAHAHLGNRFPTWVVTNWGSDIHLFGRLVEHADRIRAVLAACNYYSCECERDVRLGRDFGFQGAVLPVLPNAGGFDLRRMTSLRQGGSPCERKTIILKGYQHWAGRALTGVRAIGLAAASLKGYRVAVYLAGEDVRIAAELMSHATGIPVEFIAHCSHEEMLRWHGRSRVYIGLSISDGISTSLLEAMVMGAFPIQSNTGGAEEWIRHGENGFIVPPEDPEVVAAAIRQAVTDDALADRAAETNARIAQERLDERVIKPKVIEMYERIAKR